MAFDFPSAPSIGQKYPQPPVSGAPVYTWDGAKWTTIGGAVAGKTAVLSDGSVPMGAQLTLVAPPVNSTDAAAKSYVDGQLTAHVYSYPVLSINGAMAISQEFGTSGYYPISGGGAPKYVLDQFYVAAGGAVTLSGTQTGGGPPGFPYSMYSQSFTVIATPAAGDYGFVAQPIEGLRIARLGWGAAGAQPITIGFWVKSPITGNLALSVMNGAGNRSHVVDINIPTANVWQWCTATIPGDTAGTWAADNTVGMHLRWAYICGSSFRAAPGAWQAGNFLGTPSTMNLAASGSMLIQLAGVVAVPGTSLPPPGVIPLILPTYNQELLACSRYFQWNRNREPGFVLSGSEYVFVHTPLVPYRVAPTGSLSTTSIGFESQPWVAGYNMTGAAVNVAHVLNTGGDYSLIGSVSPVPPASNTWAVIAATAVKFDARL